MRDCPCDVSVNSPARINTRASKGCECGCMVRRAGLLILSTAYPLAFPLGFDFCGIHASLLYQNSLDGMVVFPYNTPLYWRYTIHSPLHTSLSWRGRRLVRLPG